MSPSGRAQRVCARRGETHVLAVRACFRRPRTVSRVRLESGSNPVSPTTGIWPLTSGNAGWGSSIFPLRGPDVDHPEPEDVRGPTPNLARRDLSRTSWTTGPDIERNSWAPARVSQADLDTRRCKPARRSRRYACPLPSSSGDSAADSGTVPVPVTDLRASSLRRRRLYRLAQDRVQNFRVDAPSRGQNSAPHSAQVMTIPVRRCPRWVCPAEADATAPAGDSGNPAASRAAVALLGSRPATSAVREGIWTAPRSASFSSTAAGTSPLDRRRPCSSLYCRARMP